MSRRSFPVADIEVTVGTAQDVMRIAEEQSICQISGSDLYVMGRWSDDSPLSACLWADIKRAYARHRIDSVNAAIFEAHLCGNHYRDICAAHARLRPKAKPLTEEAAWKRVQRVRDTLQGDPMMGLLTVIFEEVGGWSAVGDILFRKGGNVA